ncbi:MAG: sigma-70 family RNA polymerase sigma factor [Planctomycetes bacterium]|nr:sigma-70 family RNA polymerase sigma factor [Planctomycetota bacterium]
MREDSRNLTQMLQRGAPSEELLPLVYDELRAIARRRMGGERPEHTLQATALVHEAWLRLVPGEGMAWRDRRHFFGAAAEAMRRVLVDHARRVRSDKRGGDQQRLSITLDGLAREDDPDLLLALDEALTALAAEDPRAAEVARLRFFAGLSVDEVGRLLELAPRTAARDWAYARARLTQLLAAEG